MPDVADLTAALTASAARFARREVAPRLAALDGDDDEAAAGARAWVVAALRAAGLIDMARAAADGGSGLGATALGAVLASLGETCAGTAALVWANETALLAARAAACTPPAGALVALAAVSPSRLTAVSAAGGWVVSGSADFVWGAGGATTIFLAAATAAGGVVGFVDASTPGLSVRETHERLGLRACPSQALDFADVRLPGAAARVFATTAFAEWSAAVRAQALALLGAAACGNARGALRQAMRYAQERWQGGALIGEHGLIQELLGRALLRLRAAEALTAEALKAADEAAAGWFPAAVSDTARLAKVAATRAGEAACLDAMQVFGGYGYMRDFGVEKRLRDAKMLCLIGGDNARELAAIVRDRRREAGWP